MEETIEIIAFEDGLAPSFRDLNLAWLQRYFVVEPIDEQMLSNPRVHIIDKGGFIYFARMQGKILGCFALKRTGVSEFELSKMAVDEKHLGKKIGNRMLEAAIEMTRQLGGKRLVLYSNTLLEPAIHLYRKFGFYEIPLEDSEYKRTNIKMERLME